MKTFVPRSANREIQDAFKGVRGDITRIQNLITGASTTTTSGVTAAQLAALQNELNALQEQVDALGTSTFETFNTDTTLGTFLAVYESGNGVAALTQPDGQYGTGSATLGIIIASRSSQVDVRTFGDVDNPSWSWVEGLPIFAIADGVITQTPPTSGYIIPLGYAVSATRIRLNIEPVTLADGDTSGDFIFIDANGKHRVGNAVDEADGTGVIAKTSSDERFHKSLGPYPLLLQAGGRLVADGGYIATGAYYLSPGGVF